MKAGTYVWFAVCLGVQAIRADDFKLRQMIEAEMAQARAELQEVERTLPLDQKPLRYIQLQEDEFVPAFLDESTRREVRWKGVRLKSAQIPTFGEGGIRAGIEPVAPTGYRVEEIAPPVHYAQIREGVYAVGYYDDENNIFFQWAGVELTASQLPKDVAPQHLLREIPRFSWMQSPSGTSGHSIRPGSAPANVMPNPEAQPPLGNQFLQRRTPSRDASRGNAAGNSEGSGSTAGSWWPLAGVAALVLFAAAITATLLFAKPLRTRS